MSKEALKNVTAVCKNLNHVQKIILIDEKNSSKNSKIFSLNELIEKHSSQIFDVEGYLKRCVVDVKDQSAIIFLSSGTTGAPKGI